MKEWGRTSLGDYAHALAVEIGAPNRPPDVRQMAGLMLKNLLYGKAAGYVREQHQRWGNLGAQRQPIKDALLSSMACPELKAAHSAALAASEIAAFELPHQQWNEFVPTLMDRVRGGSEKGIAPSVQLASLECLGYTAERVSELEGLLGEEVPELHESVVDNMLTTIVEGMQATRSNDMRLAATTALRNSLSFVHKNMQLKAERDFIFQAIGEAAQCTAVEVRVLAYNCLDQIAEMYYESMQEYMTVIYQLTTDAIRNPSEDESVKMAAIEFWSTVAGVEQVLLEEERDLEGTGTALGRPPCLQYTKLAMEQLVPLLLETLTKQDEEVVEVDAWNLQAAGAVCLECISVAVEGLILPSVMPFVEQNITNPDWRLRDAAIVAFASILEGPDTGTVGNFVVQAIPVVLNAFQDPHLMVRDSAVHCIAKIFRQHGTAVPPEMLQIVLQSLIAKVQESHVVAAHACSAIFNIAQGCRTPEVLPSNALSHAMVPLLQALLAATDRQDASESNLRVSAMSAAAELVSAAAADTKPVLREFLPVIVQRMEAALRMQAANTEDSENKEILLGLLCALFTVLFQRLDRQDVLPYVDPCMQFLLETLQQRLCVEEAVLSVGAVAATLEQDFVVRPSERCKGLRSLINFFSSNCSWFSFRLEVSASVHAVSTSRLDELSRAVAMHRVCRSGRGRLQCRGTAGPTLLRLNYRSIATRTRGRQCHARPQADRHSLLRRHCVGPRSGLRAVPSNLGHDANASRS